MTTVDERWAVRRDEGTAPGFRLGGTRGNVTDKEKGSCSVCGRETVLLKDGRIGRHADKYRKLTTWSPQNCSGWGKMPKVDSAQDAA